MMHALWKLLVWVTPGGETTLTIVLLLVMVLAVTIKLWEESLPPDEWRELELSRAYGTLMPQVVCPHCQTEGHVRVKQELQKTGVSGAKAGAALMTAGTSLLVTGLSRKENFYVKTCTHCGLTSRSQA
jgi:hypothetical protein